MKKHRGFSLVEVLIGVVLSTLLLAGAYRFLVNLGTSTKDSMTSTKKNFDFLKAISRASGELTNTVAFPSNVVDPTLQTTVMKNVLPLLPPPPPGLPNRCWLDRTKPEMIVSGLLPLPGFTKADVDSRTQFTAIDPNSVYPAESQPDAVRFTHLAPDSRPYPLARQSTPPNKPYPTRQTCNPECQQCPTCPACTTCMALSTSESTPIVIEVENLNPSADALAALDFSVGDFAMIVDQTNGDLFRVTGLTSIGSGIVHVRHEPSKSIWNLPLNHHYGLGQKGEAFIQKVNVKTYAFSPDENALYMDTHVADDDFDPSQTGAARFPGTPRLAKSWTPLLNNVTQFHVQYVFLNGAGDSTIVTARNPRSGLMGDNSSDCGNQTGYPLLRHIGFEIKTEESTYQEIARPVNLMRAAAGTGQSENIVGEYFEITPIPTATPEPTPTSAGTPGTPSPTATPGPTIPPSGSPPPTATPREYVIGGGAGY